MRSPSRRDLLGVLGTCLLFDRLVTPLSAALPADAKPSPAERGRRFLESLFDPTLDLLPEFRGARVYWLFHDNYLAAKVLADTKPEMAKKIRDATHRFGIDHSGKIEILFGEAGRPLPFRQYELIDVRRVGEKLVKTEAVTQTVLQGWQEYADLLFLAAIAETDRAKARRHFDDGLKLWDGVGFKDRVASKHDQYATYKLALALLAARSLDVKAGQQPAIVERLLALQGDDGGWITDYDAHGKPRGRANVESTCLAILGLEAATARK